MFVQERAGQLFKDISIAMSSAIAMSLIVSISVIPSLASRILKIPKNMVGVDPNKTRLGREVTPPDSNIGNNNFHFGTLVVFTAAGRIFAQWKSKFCVWRNAAAAGI
jgi:multidrug efflux pump subunit AcrB